MPEARPAGAQLRAAVRYPVRRLLDGISARVVAGLSAPIRDLTDRIPTATLPPTPLFHNFHDLLHAQRTVELSRMPKGARVLLSAGCSGRWYFDWLDEHYGPVARHIGVERYVPRPDDLPAGVEWIDTSVAHMPQVADGSVDLLFSGQNIEHLFGDDVVGFLAECARVVHPGGHLVINSPHREIARLLCWSMNEHTIEFTPSEAGELVELAGFDVVDLRGVWLTRDPDSCAILPLDPYEAGASPTELLRRVQVAARYPDHSFVWWLEARRADRVADIDAVRRRHADIFSSAWPERANRLHSDVGVVRVEDGVRVATAPVGTSGVLMAGPYMPLAPGHYDVEFALRRGAGPAATDAVVANLEVAAAGGADPVIVRREVRGRDLSPELVEPHRSLIRPRGAQVDGTIPGPRHGRGTGGHPAGGADRRQGNQRLAYDDPPPSRRDHQSAMRLRCSP